MLKKDRSERDNSPDSDLTNPDAALRHVLDSPHGCLQTPDRVEGERICLSAAPAREATRNRHWGWSAVLSGFPLWTESSRWKAAGTEKAWKRNLPARSTAGRSIPFQEGVFGDTANYIYREYIGMSAIYSVICQMKEKSGNEAMEGGVLSALLFNADTDFEIR